MRKIVNILALTAITCALTALTSYGADIVLRASLDSSYIIMGKQTALRIQLLEPTTTHGSFGVAEEEWRDVEIASFQTPDTSEQNGRREILQTIMIQSFDSGLYTLPPILYIAGGETIRSNQLTLKVVPVIVDSMVTVHDYADAMKGERRFLDFMPDWLSDYGIWILLLLAVVGTGIWVWLKYFKKKESVFAEPEKTMPPYELAIKRLNELKEEHLCEQGREKDYYTRLTDILRIYLDTRFGINAMEMTSTQILRAMQSNEETRVPKSIMSEILSIADFVKFAKVRPLPDDNVRAFNQAVKFVEDTRPQETSETESGDSEKKTEGGVGL